jgi:hypothetical protein
MQCGAYFVDLLPPQPPPDLPPGLMQLRVVIGGKRKGVWSMTPPPLVSQFAVASKSGTRPAAPQRLQAQRASGARHNVSVSLGR